MLRITKYRLPVPQKGNAPDCSQLGKRVTSAACEDGHATAAGGASHSKQRSRHKRIPRHCNRSSLSQQRLARPRASRQSLRLSRMRASCKKASLLRIRQVKASRNSGATGIAVADAVGAAIANPQPRSRQRCLGQAAQLAKLPKLRSRRSPPNPWLSPRSRLSSRRARWCCRSAFRGRARARGSNVTTFCRCRVTWSASCCSTT